MPQVFWSTCPKCKTKFTAEKLLWDRNDPLMCPQCLNYFYREESPDISTVWSPSFKDLNSIIKKFKE